MVKLNGQPMWFHLVEYSLRKAEVVLEIIWQSVIHMDVK